MNWTETLQKLLRDFRYYALWWLLWGAILSFIPYVPSPNPGGVMPDSYFWSVKLQQVLWGVAFGGVCAILFTVVQNAFNAQRSKVKAWVSAVVIWLAVKFAWVAAVVT